MGCTGKGDPKSPGRSVKVASIQLRSGDRQEKECGRKTLDEVMDHASDSSDVRQASTLLIRAVPSWPGREDPAFIKEIERDLAVRPGFGDPRLKRITERLFALELRAGESLARLRQEWFDVMGPPLAAAEAACSADSNQEKRVEHILAVLKPVFDHPDYRGQVLDAWRQLQRLQLRNAAWEIESALKEWDTSAALRHLQSIDMTGAEAAEGEEWRRLEGVIRDVGDRRQRVLRAIGELKGWHGSGVETITAISGSFQEVVAAVRDGLPASEAQAARDAIDMAAARVLACIQTTAHTAADGSFAGFLEIAERIDWLLSVWPAAADGVLEPAWQEAVSRLCQEIAAAEDVQAMERIGQRIEEKSRHLPEILAGRARGVSRTVGSLATRWRQAKRGIASQAPDLVCLNGTDPSPAAAQAIIEAARSWDASMTALEGDVEQAGSVAELNACQKARRKLDTAFATTPRMVELGERIRDRSRCLQLLDFLKSPVAQWDIGGLERAASPPAPHAQRADGSQTDWFCRHLSGLRRLAEAARLDSGTNTDAVFAWWDEWSGALTGLSDPAEWPERVAEAVRVEERKRLTSFLEWLAARPADDPSDRGPLSDVLTRLERLRVFPAVEVQCERIAHDIARLNFFDAETAKNWTEAADIIKPLLAVENPPVWVRAARLILDLHRAEENAEALTAILLRRGSDLQRDLPARLAGTLIAAIRQRRAHAAPLTEDDRRLGEMAAAFAHSPGDVPMSKAEQDELGMWGAVLPLLHTLADDPDENTVGRFCSLVRGRLDYEFRRRLIPDMKRLSVGWLEAGRLIHCAWASQLFRDDDELAGFLGDALAAFLRVEMAKARDANAHIGELKSVDAEAIGEEGRTIRALARSWQTAKHMLQAAEVPEVAIPPMPVHEPLSRIEDLSELTGLILALENGDLRNPANPETCRTVRARLLHLNLSGPLSQDALARLERIESAIRVRKPWGEFAAICNALVRERRVAEGSLQRLIKAVDDMRGILKLSNVQQGRGARLLAADACSFLSKVNSRPRFSSDSLDAIASVLRQLLQEEQEVCGSIWQAERLMPPAGIGNPSDPRYEAFFNALPKEQPISRSATQLVSDFLRRDPMPAIMPRIADRLPAWMVELGTAYPPGKDLLSGKA